MAWTNPANRSTGDVITASIWNADLVANLNALSTHTHSGAAGDGASIIVPSFENDKRISLNLPIPPQSNLTGDLVVTTSTNGSMTGAWDATNKFVYTQFHVNANGGVVHVASNQAVSTQLLPEFTIGFAHVSTATNTVRAGLMDGVASADPTNGVFFRCTNGGNWFAVCRAGGVETATDTGVAASTTAKEYRITVTATNSVAFYIDDVLKATVTTNIPATTALLQARAGFTTSAVGTFNAAFAQWMGLTFETKSS